MKISTFVKVHIIVLTISSLLDPAVFKEGVRIQVRSPRLVLQQNNFKMFVAKGQVVIPHPVYTGPHLLPISLT